MDIASERFGKCTTAMTYPLSLTTARLHHQEYVRAYQETVREFLGKLRVPSLPQEGGGMGVYV